VREIRNLPLDTDLVTLSACDTGVGPVSEEGVANVVNAFIEAGAQSVVSTLWEMEDHSTAQLMIAFYQHLSEREAKADALRDAQLELLQSGDPPYFWAGFELAGEPNATLFTARQSTYPFRSGQ
jgi:CHAT domain-containing protein